MNILARFTHSYQISPILAALALGFCQSTLQASELQITTTPGGRIIDADNMQDCTANCVINSPEQRLVSLLATPEPGYGFSHWEGACANTIGPLCTFVINDDNAVSAVFATKDLQETMADKVLLLLHGPDSSYQVWNDFAKKRFDDHCPAIYGGAILSNDTLPTDGVYCYRLRFGYYSAFDNQFPDLLAEHQANEIYAAIQGIYEYHPEFRLMMLTEQGNSASLQFFLQRKKSDSMPIQGILTLTRPGTTTPETISSTNQATNVPMFRLRAEPGNEAKITNALGQVFGW